MTTTPKDRDRWIAEGKARGATHIVVMCDTFSYEDYPVYITLDQDLTIEQARLVQREMQKVMEVIKL